MLTFPDHSSRIAAASADFGLYLLTKSQDEGENIFPFGGGLSGHHGRVNDITFCGGGGEDSTRYVATVSGVFYISRPKSHTHVLISVFARWYSPIDSLFLDHASDADHSRRQDAHDLGLTPLRRRHLHRLFYIHTHPKHCRAYPGISKSAATNGLRDRIRTSAHDCQLTHLQQQRIPCLRLSRLNIHYRLAL